MHYQHIIWDYNGTLLNDVKLCVDVINKVLFKRSLPLLTIKKYKEIFDFPVKDYYRRLGFDFEKESFEIVGTEFIVEYDKSDKSKLLHTGANEFLTELKSQGIEQSVLSAREEVQLLCELKDLGVYELFTEVVGLNDHYAGGKTENGKELIEKLNISKDQILMIGDTKHDADVANECGIDCILLAHGHHAEEKLETCGVPVLNDFEKLRNYLL